MLAVALVPSYAEGSSRASSNSMLYTPPPPHAFALAVSEAIQHRII
jgi:hypothetical protein